MVDELSNTEIAAPASLDTLIALIVELVDHIRQEIRMVDFWRNTYAQNVLRVWIIRFLDDHDAVPFNRQQAVSDRLIELAKAFHTRLRARGFQKMDKVELRGCFKGCSLHPNQ